MKIWFNWDYSRALGGHFSLFSVCMMVKTENKSPTKLHQWGLIEDIETCISLMFQTERIFYTTSLFLKFEICLDSVFPISITHKQYSYFQKLPPARFEVHLQCHCRGNRLFLGHCVVVSEMGWPLTWDTPDPFCSSKPQSGRLPPLFRGPNFLCDTL